MLEPFEWQEPDGSHRTGGLLLPRDFAPGRPVPLVIQNYFYYPQAFLPDGPHSHVDAAQALVAQGIAVLQIGGVPDHIADGKLELEGAIPSSRVDAIVAA